MGLVAWVTRWSTWLRLSDGFCGVSDEVKHMASSEWWVLWRDWRGKTHGFIWVMGFVAMTNEVKHMASSEWWVLWLWLTRWSTWLRLSDGFCGVTNEVKHMADVLHKRHVPCRLVVIMFVFDGTPCDRSRLESSYCVCLILCMFGTVYVVLCMWYCVCLVLCMFGTVYVWYCVCGTVSVVSMLGTVYVWYCVQWYSLSRSRLKFSWRAL